MEESKEDAMAEDNEFEGGAAKSGGKIMKLIILAVVLLVSGAAGAWFLLLREPAQPVAEGAVALAQGPVQYLELSPAFIVNFPHQGRQRFLQASVSVMSRDQQAIDAVVQHMPAIRHNLINLFSAQLLLVFEDPSGIETLRQLATEEVKQVLRREIGRDGIDEVLFTNFVMQ